MHEHEGDEQADSGRSGRRNDDEYNVSDNVEYGKSNHGVDCLIPLGDDPADLQRRRRCCDLRHDKVERNPDERKGYLDELTGEDVKAERPIDQQGVEFSETSDHQCLKKSQRKQAVGVRVCERLPRLFFLPCLLLDALVIPSHSLH